MNIKDKNNSNINNREFKYYLGLDLGISSVGWAVMAEEIATGKHYLHDFGVRIFDIGANAIKGSAESETQKRRRLRSSRRLIRRRKYRVERIKKTLINNNFLKKEDFFKFNENKNSLKITNKVRQENDSFFTENNYYNPFVLRNKGLEKKLTKQEIFIILIHFAKKRGYLDRSLLVEESKKSKKVKSRNKEGKQFKNSIDKGEQLIIKHKFASTAILKEKHFRIPNSKNLLINFKNSKYDQDKKTNITYYRALFSRKVLKNELETILREQEKYYPDLKEIQNNIIKIIFEQRDFEVGPKCRKCQENPEIHKKAKDEENIRLKKICSRYRTFLEKIGNCAYYPEETKYYKSTLMYSAYYFVTEISKFLIHLKKDGIVFDKKFYQKILENFFLNNWKEGEEIETEIKKHKNWKKEYEHYFKSSPWKTEIKKGMDFTKAKFLKEIRTQEKIRKEIKKINFNQNFIKEIKKSWIEKIGEILTENITKTRRKKKIIELNKKQNLNLNDKEICFLTKFSQETTGVANVSSNHMYDVVNDFLECKIYEYKQKDINHKRSIGKKIFNKILDWDLFSNPVSFRTVNQTRKILKKLHAVYSKFDVITVELTRELKNKTTKDKEASKQEKNKENNDKQKQTLRDNEIDPNRNLLAYKLFLEQGNKINQGCFVCLYCNESVDLKKPEDFLPENRKTAIDHIIPISKWSNDSYNNKILVCWSCNSEKGNNLPLNFIKKNNINQFNKKVDEFFKKKNKNKWEYLKTKNEKDLEELNSRNLQDTHYLSKWIFGYIKTQTEFFKKNTKILNIKGRITSDLRQKWLQTSPWGMRKKVRDITPFHHAVDAIIISQFKRQEDVEMVSTFYSLQKLKREEKTYKEILKKIKEKIYNNEKTFFRWKKVLKNIEEKNKFSECCYIKDLENEIETRIPVKLVKKECLIEDKDDKGKITKITKCKDKNLKNNFCKNCLNQRKIPELLELQGLEEWKQENQKKKIEKERKNLRYPVISYMVNYKLRGSWATSENFGFSRSGISKEKAKKEQKKLEKQLRFLNKYKSFEEAKKHNLNLKQNEWNSWQKELDKENYILSKGNIILTNKYYGIFLKNIKESNYHWISKICLSNQIIEQREKRKKEVEFSNSLIRNIEKNKEKKLIIKNKNIMFFDKKDEKKYILNYTSRKGKDIVYIHKNQLKINNEKDRKKIKSIIENKNFKILKIDILGNWKELN